VSYQYIPIADLQPGSKVVVIYLLANFQIRPKKDGSSYVTMVLRDATGKITGVMWDNFTSVTSGAIKENDYVEVGGEVNLYNGQPQMRVHRITAVDDALVDTSFFLPKSPRCAEEMDAEVADLVSQVQDPDYRRLLDCVFGNAVFWERFRMAPSAVSMHQAYLGGLIDHTLCVTKNALKMADNYPAANRDLLITGALLHDMGKVLEFSYDRKIAYSDAGRLLGHISIGNAMIEVHCHSLGNFPIKKKILLQHMILSHHGTLEYGSPRCPATLEALILHHADLLDAQLSNYLEYTQHASKTGTRWEYSNMFERHMFGAGELIDDGNAAHNYGCSLHDHFRKLHAQLEEAEPAEALLEQEQAEEFA
jgi:3'-5' exoribonuclease